MTELVIRRAPENLLFRLVEREDLVAGTEIYMIDPETAIGSYEFEHPSRRIKLDEEPVSDRGHGFYVRYHCISPAWEGQCFVPLDEFLGERRDSRSAHYWLPVS